MAARTKYSSEVVYKFLIAKIGKLVKNSRGQLKYMSNVDNIIYDIFGVKHFTKRINESYASRDIIDVLEDIGSERLMVIMNNSRYYEAMKDLVAINRRINELRKEIRKLSKKGKRNKQLVKEFNYLTNLYKESIKRFRKILGIKNTKNSYKRRYSSLNSMIKHDKYDDDDMYTSILLQDDFDIDYDDDDYYDYDDDYETSTELDDFAKHLNGVGSRRRNSRRRINTSVDSFDLDEEDDDDYEDGYHKSYEMPSMMDDRAISHLNDLTDMVSELAGAVQTLMNKNEYETTQRRKQMYQSRPSDLTEEMLRPIGNPTPNKTSDFEQRELSILTDFVGKLSEEQIRMKNNQSTMAQALDQIIHNEEVIMNALGGLDEEYDDEVEVVIGTPVMHDTPANDVINRYPDVYADDEEVGNPEDKPIHREDLIDQINNSVKEEKPSGKNK